MLKKQGNVVVILVVAMLFLLIAAVVVFGVINNSPKGIVKTNTSKALDLMGNSIAQAKEEMTKVKEKGIEANAKIKLDLDLSDEIISTDELKKVQQKINSSEIKSNIAFNEKSKYIKFNLGFDLDNKNLIDLDANIKDKTAYLKLKDVIDEYVKYDLDDEIDFSIEQLDIYEDLETVYNAVKPTIKKSILKGDISSEKATIKIDDKDVKVNKTTIKVDDRFTNQLTIDVINKIKDDKKALESARNIYNILESKELTEDEFVKYLNDEIDSAQKIIDDFKVEDAEYATISIYTKSVLGVMNKTVGYESVSRDEESKISIVFNSNSNCSIAIESDGEEILVANGKISKESCDLEYTLTDATEKKEYTGKLIITSEKVNKDEVKEHIEFSIDTGKDLGAIGIIMDVDFKYVDVTVPDFSNVKDINEAITEDTSTKLINKLQEIMDAFELDMNASDLLMLFGGGITEPQYNFDEEPDYDFDLEPQYDASIEY